MPAAKRTKWTKGRKYCQKYRKGANKYGPWKRCAQFGNYGRGRARASRSVKKTTRKTKKKAPAKATRTYLHKTQNRGPLKGGYIGGFAKRKGVSYYNGKMPGLEDIPLIMPAHSGSLMPSLYEPPSKSRY